MEESKKKNTNTYVIGGVVLVILVLVVIAFSLSSQTKPTNPAPQAVETIKVDHQTGGLIPNFPSFPMYPGATIGTSQHVQGEKSYQVYLASPDSVKGIMAWYKKELTASGWTIDRDVDPNTPTDQNIVVSKTGMKATVNAEREGDDTDISVHVETL